MSRSFHESYMGKPYQAIRGWYRGKKREGAKSARYKLASMFDEDGVPQLPGVSGQHYRFAAGRCWKFPEKGYEIIRRNGRKLLRRRKNFIDEDQYRTA